MEAITKQRQQSQQHQSHAEPSRRLFVTSPLRLQTSPGERKATNCASKSGLLAQPATGMAVILSLIIMSMDRIPIEIMANPLALGLSLGSEPQRHPVEYQATTPSIAGSWVLGHQLSNFDTLDQLLLGQEFAITEQILGSLDTLLSHFATQESLSAEEIAKGHAVSLWFARATGMQTSGQKIEAMASELDFVYEKYGSQIRPLIQQIINAKPASATLDQLAFRCQHFAELDALKQLAANSSIYQMLVDTFFVELYNHCLDRKLATIKILQIKPAQNLRQLVDIYLDLPTHLGSGDMMDVEAASILANNALQFDLSQVVARHGPLESTANLLLDAKMMGFAVDHGEGVRSIVGGFREDCRRHIEQLASVWLDFDNVAQFLSSSMSNLMEYNRQIKLVSPQLVYGSLCSQLASASNT